MSGKEQTSIYLHFPFCSKLCGYCDFHKEILDRRKERLFWDALSIETELAVEEAAGKEIVTLYIGGGTPSLADPTGFANWVNTLHKHYSFAENIEFTVEVNPESANKENLGLFVESGVNRLSVGVQSFNTKSLFALSRRHKTEDTLRVFYLARALGLDDYSADLIFGLPNQTLKDLESDLIQLCELEPTHVSFYQLTVKEDTPLYDQVQSGAVTLPDDDTMAVFYSAGMDYLAEHKLERYEISSFAKEGKQGLHNFRYWRAESYIGLGPGAHGFTGEKRYANFSDTSRYITELIDKKKRPRRFDARNKRDQMIEEIMLGLRMTEGVQRKKFFKRHGKHVIEAVNKTEYKHLVESGLLIPEASQLRLSEEGLALADEIIARLALYP